MGFVLFEKSVTVSGTFDGTESDRYDISYTVTPPPFNLYRNTCDFGASCDWGSFTAVPVDTYPVGSPPYKYRGWQVSVTALSTTLSATSQEAAYGTPGSTPANANWSVPPGGSFSMSATLQLCLEDTGGASPSYSAGVTPDPPFLAARRYYWRLKPGSTVTTSASAGAASKTSTATVPSLPTESRVGDAISFYCNSSSACGWGSASGGATISCSSTLGATAGDTTSASSTHGNATANTSSNTITLVTTAQETAFPSPASGDIYQSNASGTISCAVPRPYDISLAMYRMKASEGDTYSVYWNKGASLTDTVSVTGSWSSSFTQEQYSATSTVGEKAVTSQVAQTKSKNNFSPVSLALTTAPTVGGTAVDNTTIGLRDLQMSGLTLSLPSTRTLNSGSDTVVGALTTRSWSGLTNGREYMNPYRYLDVRQKSTSGDNRPFTVAIGSKSWSKDKTGASLVTGLVTVFATQTIDICSPGNATASLDSVNCTYPLAIDPGAVSALAAETSTGNYRTGEGAYRGILQSTSLALNGTNVQLSTLTLNRVNAPILTFLHPWKNWVTQRPSTTVSLADTITSHRAWPFLWAECDGKPALEESGVFWDETVGGVSGVTTWSFAIPTINDLNTLLNDTTRGGWASSLNAPADDASVNAHDGYYNRTRPAWGLGGGGWTHTGDGGWVSWIEATSLSPVWQGSFSSVEFPGAIGDVMGHAPTPGVGAPAANTTIAGCHVFGGDAYGLALQTNNQPDSAATATLYQGGSSFGTGASDSIGQYHTGSPYGRGGTASKVTLGASTADGVTYTSRTRLRQWAVMRRLTTYIKSAIDNAKGFLHLGTDKKVSTYYADDVAHVAGAAIKFSSADYSIDNWLAMDYDPRRALLYGVGKSSTSLKVIRSRDSGVTGTEVLTVTAVSTGIVVDPERGMVVFFYENAGNIKRRTSEDGGTTWAAAADITIDGSTTAGTISDVKASGRYAGMMLMVVSISGSTKVVRSRDRGLTWATVLS